MGDELYDVRNSLWVGNFHQAIAEGTAARTVLKKPEDINAFNIDRTALVSRAQVGVNQYDAVIAELRSSAHPTLIAIRHFAEYSRSIAAGGDGSESLKRLVEDVQDEPLQSQKCDAAVMAVSALITSRDYAAALRLSNKWVSALDLNNAQQSRAILELRALSADALLRLHRSDLAEKEVTAMKAVDDEATLTVLTSGLVALRQAAAKRDKFDEAAQQFQEINARCGTSIMALNLLALANVGRGRHTEAEKNLVDALSKKSGDADTSANVAVIAAQSGKSLEQVQRLAQQARNAPGSQWAKSYQAMEDRFAEAVAAFS